MPARPRSAVRQRKRPKAWPHRPPRAPGAPPVTSATELGYWLLPRHRGLGLVREAIECLIALQDASITAIFATVDRGNIPSMKLLEKAGFHLTGEHTRKSPNRQGNLVVLHYHRALMRSADAGLSSRL